MEQQLDPKPEILKGLVERVTFHIPESGFCVLRIKARSHRDLVTTVGHAAVISAGDEKPRVSAFTSADIPRILSLEPDFVLTFSELQAANAQALLREDVTVFGVNQRDVAGILAMIRTLRALVGAGGRAKPLARSYEQRLKRLRAASENRVRPRVYFEEWDESDDQRHWVGFRTDPYRGGRDVFAGLAVRKAAKDRIVQSVDVIQAAPEVILASWCGKKVRPERIGARPGWEEIPAVASGAIHEIKSPLILQPGPAALTNGPDAIIAALA